MYVFAIMLWRLCFFSSVFQHVCISVVFDPPWQVVVSMHLNNLIGFSLESNKQCVVTGPKDCPKKNNPTEFNPIDWKTSANGQTRTHTHSNICKCCTEETVFCKLLHAWLLWQIHLLSQINPWSDHRWRYLIRNSWVLRILTPPDLDREPGNSVMAKEDLGKIGSWNSTKKLWTCKLVAVPQACLTF